MIQRLSLHRRLLLYVLLAATLMSALAVFVGSKASNTYARSTVQTALQSQTGGEKCKSKICIFPLQVNPGLLSGKPFACPAIQNARAQITITNRFATGALNDVMILTASGLPRNTGFDMFLVQSSPLDPGFTSFGFGWYQSDVQSNSKGNAEVRVQGIFDKETFIENPADPFNPIHTFDVGFWFNTPQEEAKVCPSATPAKTPFSGEQDAGLLAMITSGEPLQFVV
jgi:hypothetical protein